jgi:hypothetical protein
MFEMRQISDNKIIGTVSCPVKYTDDIEIYLTHKNEEITMSANYFKEDRHLLLFLTDELEDSYGEFISSDLINGANGKPN